MTIEENCLTVEHFLNLRHSVGWTGDARQVRKALENGLYCITVKDGEQIMGMGRLVGDGVMYWYIQDLIVKPEYQGRGVGKMMMNRLLRHIKEQSLPDTTVSVCLMSVKGKEPFYEKLGFLARPSEQYGAGMIMKCLIPTEGN